jgi:2-amino-4-hydroxy-6-hydroxymethyldihydropteridine diphosphokinase
VKTAYLSLGANRGDRVENIGKALGLLAQAGVEVRRVSSFYKTEPVGFRAQSWFVNCVAEVSTDLMPMQLLNAIKKIERSLGRRSGVPNGPRPMDIDILLYENVTMHSSELTIPHERLTERKFVLIPLRELAADARHPKTQRTVLEMLQETSDTSQVLKLKSES